MRVAEILGKINIDTHLEGYWNDGEIMYEIAWGLDVGGSREILEEDRVEGFEIVLGRCLEEIKWKPLEAWMSTLKYFQYSSLSKETWESI